MATERQPKTIPIISSLFSKNVQIYGDASKIHTDISLVVIYLKQHSYNINAQVVISIALNVRAEANDSEATYSITEST